MKTYSSGIINDLRSVPINDNYYIDNNNHFDESHFKQIASVDNELFYENIANVMENINQQTNFNQTGGTKPTTYKEKYNQYKTNVFKSQK